jgi:hypothetical protein
MAVHLVGRTVRWKPAGSWLTIPNSAIVDFGGQIESAVSDIGVGFGDTAYTSISLSILRSALSASSDYTRIPFEITPTVDAMSNVGFFGFSVEARGVKTVTIECQGILSDLSRRLKDTYTPLRQNRTIATKTTASSIEDPDDPDYVGGLINEGFWLAGGRPEAQSATYTDPVFYYDCHQALFASDYGWLAGDDGLQEMLRLARAAGGQLYQRNDGVVVYISPYAMVSTPTYTFSDLTATATDSLGVYGAIDESEASRKYATKIVGQFVPRVERAPQVVIEDKTPRLVKAGETITIPLMCDHPLTQIELASATTLPAVAWDVQRLDGQRVSPGVGGYLHHVTLEGQRVLIIYENDTAFPHWIYSITVRGNPVTAGEAQTISVGSGDDPLTQEENIYIQNASHAERLAQIALAFYGTRRKVRTLSGCAFHPERYVGETVGLTNATLSLTNVPHMIINIAHSAANKRADYVLVDVTGIPVKEDYFLVSTSSQAGLTKKLTW